MTEQVQHMIARWQAARAAVMAAERAEHPDVTDKYGRVWRWQKGDLYVHDQLAWPLTLITSPHIGLPGPGLADNPNYDLCAICTQDWPAKEVPHGQDEDADGASRRDAARAAGTAGDPAGGAERPAAVPDA